MVLIVQKIQQRQSFVLKEAIAFLVLDMETNIYAQKERLVM